jgi:Tfp pilus assembly protein PilV
MKLNRRGASITEMLVALIVIAVAMTALAQLVSTSARQRRSSEARRLATQELANQAERVAALAWEEAAPDKLTGWQPSAELSAAAAAPVCRAAVTDEDGPPRSRRIRLEVSWTTAGGEAVTPLALTVWKYPGEDAP